MGGISESNLSTSEDGDGIFQGYVSTENNGGFCSIRHSLSRKYIGNNKVLKLKIKGDEIKIMKSIKKSLDPKNILNPGKIFD